MRECGFGDAAKGCAITLSRVTLVVAPSRVTLVVALSRVTIVVALSRVTLVVVLSRVTLVVALSLSRGRRRRSWIRVRHSASAGAPAWLAA